MICKQFNNRAAPQDMVDAAEAVKDDGCNNCKRSEFA